MPAAETFAAIALASATREILGGHISSVIAVVDCAPAAATLSALYSTAPQLRRLVDGAVLVTTRWLGVAVPRELNSIADTLSHPSRRREVFQELVRLGFTLRVTSISDDLWDLASQAALLPLGVEEGEADEHEISVASAPPSHPRRSRS